MISLRQTAADLTQAGGLRATFDALYAEGPDVIVGGVFSPAGTAVPVDGGYRVSGRWAFASGCEDCQWLFANCMEDHGGEIALADVEGGGGAQITLTFPFTQKPQVDPNNKGPEDEQERIADRV